LRHLYEWVARRHQIADAYDRDLAGLPLILPRRSSDSLSGLHLYVVQVAGANLSRRQVFDAMRAAGIGVTVHYIPVHTQPYY
ncbi:DegT/DnrJ/EryC1/StrS family aminotransferase, partial [Pseudomonas aeruginosa]